MSVFDLQEHLARDKGWLAGKVLDVRTEADFMHIHLLGAASLPLAGRSEPDWSDAALQRDLPSIFLPPRPVPLLVLGPAGDAAHRVADHLRSRSRPQVSSLAVTPADLETLPAGLVERGAASAHLWAPPLLLARHAHRLPPPVAGPVLDLGCGNGRACVWLAERGYRTVGVDRQPEAVALGHDLAASRGVTCDFREADLRRPGAVPRGDWAVLLNFRFLERDLLGDVVKRLRPGGVALISTFRHVPGYDGHPHLRHRLQRAELLRYFPAGQFEILVHDEGHDPDGRPAAGIVARRSRA